MLTNLTLDFLDKHWAKEIDFVVWTGDSARHDNDRELPRTPGEIYELNRAISRRMEEVFVRRGVPVVPCLGKCIEGKMPLYLLGSFRSISGY